MAFPDGFLDELVARCDIADVVSSYVPLTPKGRNLWGLCPFHSEKTPSFSVSQEKQIYHCFGCGKGGGVINFVMEMEHLPFPDAVRLLAARVGLEVPEGGTEQSRKQRDRLVEANRAAAHFYHETLNSPAGAAGADYFQRRGIAKSTVTRFGLGMAPDSWDGLILALGRQGYT
jgi:DNA primase